MPSPRMFELADKLLRLSRAGKVPWDQTIRGGEFRVDFPDVSLAISHKANTDTYRLEVIGDTGNVVASLDWSPDSEATSTQGLREIYELAESYIQESAMERALGYMDAIHGA